MVIFPIDLHLPRHNHLLLAIFSLRQGTGKSKPLHRVGIVRWVKIIELHDDGRIPLDNPFQDKGDLAKSFWSIGHRNALGLAFDNALARFGRMKWAPAVTTG